MRGTLGAASCLLLAALESLAREGADPAMHQLPDDPQAVVLEWRSAGRQAAVAGALIWRCAPTAC